MKKVFLILCALFLGIGTGAQAQMAPTPQSAPRTPVQKEVILNHKPPQAPPHTIDGKLEVLEIERLRIGDITMRLFGIVPPQLSANYGPQARAALDNLTANQNVNCQIRDRDQSGRFLATCRVGNNDLAVELLRRGLAVTARGSLTSMDLFEPYVVAEQMAQSQKLGLWSVAVPQGALVPVAPSKPETPVAAPSVAETKKDDKAPVEKTTEATEVQNKVSSVTSVVSAADDIARPQNDSSLLSATNFFARYQILMAGFLMLITALSIFGIIAVQNRLERRDERKAIAAALRGELMAARGVCQGRLKSIQNDTDPKAIVWPRIRATLYQAYVGRLGWLGAELARQIASIYGQASDYASYYNSEDETRNESTSRRQALQTLANYIEEVLPKLAFIEQTGKLGAVTKGSIKTEKNVAAASKMGMPTGLWNVLHNFSRERFPEKKTQILEAESTEEGMVEYAALIEAEMENLAFAETASDVEKTPQNVTKINRGS